MKRSPLHRLLDICEARAACALPFLPAALFALLPKWLLLRDEGFLVAARAAGYVVPGDRWQETLGWVDRLAFFRYDLLLNFLLIPLLLVALAGPLRPRWRAAFVGLVSAAVVLLVFADMLSFSNVGRYLTPAMFLDAARWGFNNPQYITTYVSLSSVVKLIATLFAIALLTAWTHRLAVAPECRRSRRGPLLLAVLLIFPAVTAFTGAYTRLPTTSLHRPALQQMSASLVEHETDAGELDRLPAAELKALFDAASSTRRAPRDARYFARARDSDLIVFLFETGPNRSLDVTGDLHDFPNLRALRRHALVAASHHSTYPYTSRALYSILSGTYPVDALDHYFFSGRQPRLPGWPRALLTDGYVTASYAPGHSQFTPDTTLLHALGIAEDHVTRDTFRSGEAWEQVLARDRAALNEMLGDMERWLAADRRYAVLFMPQVGHGPWHDLTGAGDDYPARGRALMALQDQWLGEIVALLERHGRLDQTVILVTADHGVRTRSEDPAFRGGMIDDYSFHVPLLLWAPRAFPRGATVRELTSHIDLAPTLLDLLGDESDRAPFQGVDLWDPNAATRKVWFLGKGYLGADGLRENDRFLMTNYLLHSAYGSARLAFTDDDLIAPDSKEARRLFRDMGRMEALRTSWLNHLIAPP
jgi:hypothetical protein